jgi:hypothetical protein
MMSRYGRSVTRWVATAGGASTGEGGVARKGAHSKRRVAANECCSWRFVWSGGKGFPPT